MPGLGLSLRLGRNKNLKKNLLLDKFGGAAAAYSLRALSSSVKNVVRVRRSSNNEERDFSPSEIEDGTLLLWVGTGASDNGFVTTWYDQSGNNNDAEQLLEAEQPKIVDAGILVEDNGKPAILPDGVDDHLDIPTQILKSVFIVAEPETSSNGIIGGYISTQTTGLTYRSNVFDSHSFPSKTTQSIWSAFAIGSSNPRNVYVYRDGIASIDNPKSLNLIIDCRSIFDRNSGGKYRKKAQEIIIYSTDQSANRELIEDNINNQYNIY